MTPTGHARARTRAAGFTLLELLVGLAVGAVVLTQLLVATFALERSFGAADYRMNAQNDQLRALDFLSRDLHMASAVSVQNGGTSLTLTLPSTEAATLNLNLNLGTLLTPLLAQSAPPSNATMVSYYLLGGELIRETKGAQTVLANTVADVAFVQQGVFVSIDLRFTPQYSGVPTTAALASTRASSRVFLRGLVTTG